MKLRFRRKSRPPPGGYQYFHSETQHVSSGSNYDDWLHNIRKHCESNGLVPVSAEDAENQICMKLSPDLASRVCNTEGPAQTVNGIGLTLSDIVRGTKTIAHWKLAGSPLVSPEEANRRAEICRRCYRNSPFSSPCGTVCQELVSLVESIVGGAKTAYHDQLHGCAVCSCSLKAKVHIPLDVLRKTEAEEHQELFPSECWQKAGNDTISA